jgi:hypothetical protein
MPGPLKVTILVTPQERKAWKMAALYRNRTMTEVIRELMNDWAEVQLAGIQYQNAAVIEGQAEEQLAEEEKEKK